MSDSISLYKKYRLAYMAKPTHRILKTQPDSVGAFKYSHIAPTVCGKANSMTEARELATELLDKSTHAATAGIVIFKAVEAIVPERVPVKTITIK